MARRIGPFTPKVSQGGAAADGALNARATAIVAHNDLLAIGVVQRLTQRSVRVPEDVSVVGFDDVPQAEFYWPALTTVAQDFSELGRRALSVALAAVRGDDGTTVDLIEPHLLIRSSTAPPGG